MIVRWLYTLLTHLLLPLIAWLLYRPRKGKQGFASRWPEHWGFCPKPIGNNPLWIHTVSVGETIAVTPLIRALKAQHPELAILLTTTTRTGAEQALRLGELVEHRYAPLDYPWAIGRFLDRVQPCGIWIMETELWPNWLYAAQKRHLPVTVLNGRLSERSCLRYQKLGKSFAELTQGVSHFCCQHQEDASRFERLGIDAERLSVTGSIKFDLEYDEAITEQGHKLRGEISTSRPVWIAASTHAGEDELLLEAHRALLASAPNALLILVPRHPERFAAVANLIEERGFTAINRSSAKPITAEVQVYLGDTMGELPILFAAADIAFVGGSLIPRGGHNLLEPAALGKPVLTGSSYFNFTEITKQLLCHHGAAIVDNSEVMAQKLKALFFDPNAQKAMGDAARAVVLRNQGAVQRTLNDALNTLSLDY